MDAETWIWTLIMFGGTIAVVLGLVVVAWRKDDEHVEREPNPDLGSGHA